jgi:phosphoribosyl 1,2-cyclic phosphate phosphodiesterase
LLRRAFQALAGVKVWVLGVVTPIENDKHINVDMALKWIERVRPQRAYFTHMGARMDYETLCRTLPDYIRPVYDNMEIEIK